MVEFFCNLVLLLGDVKLANTCFRHMTVCQYILKISNVRHSSTSQLSLQVVRKIASCARGLLLLRYGVQRHL